MNFESLIFDIDGTLWDTRAIVARGYNAQLKDEGMEQFSVDVDILKTVFGKITTEIADILFAALPEEQRLPILERCIAREDEELLKDPCDVSYPKVKETLEELAKKHRLFIVSNSQCGYPQLIIEKMGLEHLITAHLCYGDTHMCKGDTIKKLMEEQNITSACYIGDTQGDLEASERAGIPFVFCAFGFGQVDHYWKKIDTFADLLSL